MKEKIFFIINSKNLKRCKDLTKLKEKLSTKYDLNFLYTNFIGDATIKSKIAVEKKADYIIATGGDGTINEVANGILQSKPEHKPILCIFPCGTGDDFIKTLKIRPLLKAFSDIKLKEIDVLKINFFNEKNKKETRYCLNIADIGVSALTVKIVNGSKKRLGSALTFMAGATKAFLNYKPNNVSITGDNFSYKGKIATVAFANGKYFGGGMCIAPLAIIDDGNIDVTVVGDVSTFTFLKHYFKLRKEKKINHPQVFYYKTKKIEIKNLGKNKSPLEADGEFFGYTPAKIKIIPNKIKILI